MQQKLSTTLWRVGITEVPYSRHHNPLLITNSSWILTIHKGRIFWKKLLEKTFLTFKKWVKNIQTPGYNGVRLVVRMLSFITWYDWKPRTLWVTDSLHFEAIFIHVGEIENVRLACWVLPAYLLSVKLRFSENATKFLQITILQMSYVVSVKSTVEILQKKLWPSQNIWTLIMRTVKCC